MSSFDSRKWRNGSLRVKSDPSLDDSTRSPSSLCNSISSSPSTPPKKIWERQYRSFLKRKGSNESTPEKVHEGTARYVSNSNMVNNKSGSFSLVPGSKRLLMRPSKNERNVSEAPKIPTLTKTKSSGDMTVKGGSFFTQMFQKDNTKKPPHTRKAKSMDCLDQTLRRGHEKSYSPRSGRILQTESLDDDKFHMPPVSFSSSSLQTTFEQDEERKASDLPESSRICADKSATMPHRRNFQSEREGNEKVRKSPVSLLSNSLQANLELKQQTKSSEIPESLTLFAKKPATTEIKKAFTEIHNSSVFATDSTSAYLGEDSSTRGKAYLAMYNQLATHHKDSSHFQRDKKRVPPPVGISKSLEPFTDGYLRHNSHPILKAVLGPETWKDNHRYLMIPAILAICPLGVMSKLAGLKQLRDFNTSPFGTLQLGAATMTFVVGQQRVDNNGWSACSLELRQNYLLEYDRDSTSIPRGFAHLEGAVASPHTDFLNALELEYYGSPCARSDKRKLLIRVENTADRDRWVSCLNNAAQLDISDLYDYDEEENLLGTGRYAHVYKARRRDSSQTAPNRALKVVDKNEFWSRVVRGRERSDTIVREVSVQATLTAKGDRGAPVVKIYGLFETTKEIVMECELLAGNDLFAHLSSKNVLNENEAARILRDILTSLAAMNRFGVSHRDIKPANILMNEMGEDDVSVKVADFGMSAFVGVDGLLRGRCGTPGYVAPEIFLAGVSGGYGNKVDIFSAGVTLYIMLCGYEPFYGETDKELIDANKNAILEFPDGEWDRVSPEARDLVEKMLKADPSERINAAEALRHSWITNRVCGKPSTRNFSTEVAEGAACRIS